MRKLLVCLGPIVLSLTTLVHAQSFSVHITVDENGVGSFSNSDGFSSPLIGTLQNDPGPGGLANVLTYSLLNPPGLVAGDLFLQDPGDGILDVVRFNSSNGTLVFYSDNTDGFDSLADTNSPPLAFYQNQFTIPEIGPEGDNFASYTPIAGQPGFVADAGGPVTYTLISDGSVPEPSSFVLLGTGLAGMLGMARRRLFA